MGSEAKAPTPPHQHPGSVLLRPRPLLSPAQLACSERPLEDPGAPGLVGPAGTAPPMHPAPPEALDTQGTDGRPPAERGAGHVQHGEGPRCRPTARPPRAGSSRWRNTGLRSSDAEAINPRLRKPARAVHLPATRRVTVSGPSEWTDCSNTTGRRSTRTRRNERLGKMKEQFKSLGRKSIGAGRAASCTPGRAAPLSPRPAPGKRKLPACEGGRIDTAVSEQTLFHIWLASAARPGRVNKPLRAGGGAASGPTRRRPSSLLCEPQGPRPPD